MLAHPLVLWSIAGVAAALAIVLWPDRSDQILARLLADELGQSVTVDLRLAVAERQVVEAEPGG